MKCHLYLPVVSYLNGDGTQYAYVKTVEYEELPGVSTSGAMFDSVALFSNPANVQMAGGFFVPVTERRWTSETNGDVILRLGWVLVDAPQVVVDGPDYRPRLLWKSSNVGNLYERLLGSGWDRFAA